MISSRAALLLAAVTALLAAVVVGGVVLLLRDVPDVTLKPSAVDIGFAQDMSVHHDQAVQMAGIARERGGSYVRTLAATIEVNQSQEIGTMRGWLALWNEPQLPSGDVMTWMADGHHAPETDGSMPGIATVDEMDRLRSASGDAFDRLFLELMIRHHQGGVVMAEDAARRATLPTTRRLAKAIVFEQSNEMTEMSGLSVGHDAAQG